MRVLMFCCNFADVNNNSRRGGFRETSKFKIMYFVLEELKAAGKVPYTIQVKNLVEAREAANEIGKQNGFHHVHFYKWNAGTGSLQGKDRAAKRHCVTVK